MLALRDWRPEQGGAVSRQTLTLLPRLHSVHTANIVLGLVALKMNDVPDAEGSFWPPQEPRALQSSTVGPQPGIGEGASR